MGIKIALAGNPNSGKTTLFNALTGSNQFVGNWPGVTVEKKEGKLKGHEDVIITDLPGIYSLSPYTLEEVVARNYLITERPDAILNIVDGTNLERNLYLTTQLTELGIPVVIALNMIDLIEKKGDFINVEELSRQLGCKIVSISALKGTNVQQAAEAAVKAAKETKTVPMHTFSGPVEHALAHIEEITVHNLPEEQQRWYAIKLFERDEKVRAQLNLKPDTIKHIENDIAACEKEMDDDAESIITNERYVYIGEMLKGVYKKVGVGQLTTSDKIDKIVTNRILGLPIFALVMFGVYWLAMGPFGSFLTDWTNDVFAAEWMEGGVAALLESWGVSEWIVSLVADGIVHGVGAVLGFVPQMIVLFLMLCILEDVGYMARVAFIMDRVFRKFGLSGKSFIPMLIGSGCGVPGVMATRTIENERDRRMTIMTTCFIPCGAKLPIIGLIANAVFGGGAWVAASAYFVGVASIIISGIMLKKTKMFAGDPAPFVMELPPYHVPSATNVFRGTWERGWSFIKRAGSVIVLSSIVIWVLNSLSFEGGLHYLGEGAEGASILENVGNLFAWIFKPLGFGTWQATVATILGLVAKEDVVGTIGTLISMEDLPDLVEEGENIAGVLDVFFNSSTAAAYAFMLFNLLCAPCFAAMGAIKREMNNAKWTAFAIGYMTVFAYAIALIYYQIASAIKGEVHVIGLVVALAILAGMIYMLFFKKYEESEKLTQEVKVK
ncbi:MAG: ferrous iron transport protein B [Erysipelotrichaceae bacterium]|nr:ferrous iron transport protein B [Erysipelotrichaceae bacterium]